MSETLSMREVARVLGVSQLRVRELIRKGTLNAEKVVEGATERWTILSDSVETYLAKRPPRPAADDGVALASLVSELRTHLGKSIHLLDRLSASLANGAAPVADADPREAAKKAVEAAKKAVEAAREMKTVTADEPGQAPAVQPAKAKVPPPKAAAPKAADEPKADKPRAEKPKPKPEQPKAAAEAASPATKSKTAMEAALQAAGVKPGPAPKKSAAKKTARKTKT